MKKSKHYTKKQLEYFKGGSDFRKFIKMIRMSGGIEPSLTWDLATPNVLGANLVGDGGIVLSFSPSEILSQLGGDPMKKIIQTVNMLWVVPLYYLAIAPYLYLRYKDIRIIQGTGLHKLLEKCIGEIKYD